MPINEFHQDQKCEALHKRSPKERWQEECEKLPGGCIRHSHRKKSETLWPTSTYRIQQRGRTETHWCRQWTKLKIGYGNQQPGEGLGNCKASWDFTRTVCSSMTYQTVKGQKAWLQLKVFGLPRPVFYHQARLLNSCNFSIRKAICVHTTTRNFVYQQRWENEQ